MDLLLLVVAIVLMVVAIALAGSFAKARADNQRLFLQNLALQEELRATRSAFQSFSDRSCRSHRQEVDAVHARHRRTAEKYRDARAFAELLEETIKVKQKAIVALCDTLESIALRSPGNGKFCRVVSVNVLEDELIIHLKDDESIVVRF